MEDQRLWTMVYSPTQQAVRLDIGLHGNYVLAKSSKSRLKQT